MHSFRSNSFQLLLLLACLFVSCKKQTDVTVNQKSSRLEAIESKDIDAPKAKIQEKEKAKPKPDHYVVQNGVKYPVYERRIPVKAEWSDHRKRMHEINEDIRITYADIRALSGRDMKKYRQYVREYQPRLMELQKKRMELMKEIRDSQQSQIDQKPKTQGKDTIIEDEPTSNVVKTIELESQ